MEISGRDKWKEYGRAAAQKIFPRKRKKIAMLVAKPRFLLRACTRTTRGIFLLSSGIGNTYEEASAFSHVVYVSKQVQPRRISSFHSYFHSCICTFSPAEDPRVISLSSYSNLWPSNYYVSIQWQIFAPRYLSQRNFISRERSRKQNIVPESIKEINLLALQGYHFPRTFSKTLFYSHHPFTNKILLLANGCYLASFNRKQPFLCSFSPLDHFDPIQRRPT